MRSGFVSEENDDTETWGQHFLARAPARPGYGLLLQALTIAFYFAKHADFIAVLDLRHWHLTAGSLHLDCCFVGLSGCGLRDLGTCLQGELANP